MQARIVDSPIGQLQLVAESGYVTELNWPACHRAVALPSGNNDDVLSIAADELGQFFLGSRRAFTTPINAQGTNFQLRVWKELLTIKWGKTRTYKDVAMLVGLPKGARAVGSAIGLKPKQPSIEEGHTHCRHIIVIDFSATYETCACDYSETLGRPGVY